MATILSRIRAWFRPEPTESAEPSNPLLLHYSLFGYGTLCGFGDGIFRWTAELEHVTCMACKERAEKMRLHNLVTVR